VHVPTAHPATEGGLVLAAKLFDEPRFDFLSIDQKADEIGRAAACMRIRHMSGAGEETGRNLEIGMALTCRC